MPEKISEKQNNSEVTLLHTILSFTKNTKIFKGISRALSLILVSLMVFTWALLATLALLITLITEMPSLAHLWQKDKQRTKRTKEIIQHSGPKSREEHTGTWTTSGNGENYVYDYDSNSRNSQDSTNSYF